MDTLVMVFSFVGLGPPRILDGDPQHFKVGAPGRKFVIRVWIGLPKKAALYTMNFPPEQRVR